MPLKAITLMMEAVNSFETLVTIYETTRGNIPEHTHLHTRRRENLKFHREGFFYNTN
jgi:hypothetical protein